MPSLAIQSKLKIGRKADAAMRASAALIQPKAMEVVVDERDLLERLVKSALEQAIDYLGKRIPENDPEFSRKWAIKSSLIATALSTQTKVDELQLRREKNDGFEALMRRVEAVQRERALEHPSPPLSVA